MAEWKEEGFVVRTGHFRESDLWLRILLKEHGLQTVFAFGAAKSRRRFCGCLDILNTLYCRIRSNRTGQYLTLEEASLINAPVSLRTNWQYMGIAANCLKLVEAIEMERSAAGACYELLEDLKVTLEHDLPVYCQYFFRIKLLSILGLAPDFAHCAKCGKIMNNENGLLLVPEGQLCCRNCGRKMAWNEKKLAIDLSAAAIGQLSYSTNTLPHQWINHNLPQEDCRQCGRAIDAIMEYHLGLVWDNGFFRKI